MAFKQGRVTKFFLDNSAGTLIDLSAYVDHVDVPEDQEMHDTTTFGKNARTFLPGLRSGTVSISGKWDTVIEAHMAGLLALQTGASATFEYGPEGNTTGNRRITGECFLTKYEPPAQVDGVTPFTAEFQVTDTITRNTY